MMDKSILRAQFLKKRKSLNPSQLQIANQQIWERLKEFLEWKQIKGMHLYLSVASKQEVDTSPILEYVRKFHPHIEIVVPRIAKDGELEHILCDEHTPLQDNPWGIPEPTSGAIYDIRNLQVAIVPLIVFDMNGHRIGYGKGYYDRFLGACSPAVEKIGLSLFPPVDSIRTEITDVSLDAVITPHKIYQFQKP